MSFHLDHFFLVFRCGGPETPKGRSSLDSGPRANCHGAISHGSIELLRIVTGTYMYRPLQPLLHDSLAKELHRSFTGQNRRNKYSYIRRQLRAPSRRPNNERVRSPKRATAIAISLALITLVFRHAASTLKHTEKEARSSRQDYSMKRCA